MPKERQDRFRTPGSPSTDHNDHTEPDREAVGLFHTLLADKQKGVGVTPHAFGTSRYYAAFFVAAGATC